MVGGDFPSLAWLTEEYGARRIRTADLLGAIQALCQLSYSPECVGGRFVPAPSQGEG